MPKLFFFFAPPLPLYFLSLSQTLPSPCSTFTSLPFLPFLTFCFFLLPSVSVFLFFCSFLILRLYITPIPLSLSLRVLLRLQSLPFLHHLSSCLLPYLVFLCVFILLSSNFLAFHSFRPSFLSMFFLYSRYSAFLSSPSVCLCLSLSSLIVPVSTPSTSFFPTSSCFFLYPHHFIFLSSSSLPRYF